MDPDNNLTIIRFYEAFNAGDGDAMAAYYSPDARFSDPVFKDLHGAEVGGMWKMLTSAGSNLSVELVAHGAEGEGGGYAHWLADYDFSRTGRRVHNDVHAAFRFDANGLITEHLDDFNLYAWAKQALGPVGVLLGWTPPLQSSLRSTARKTLAKYMETAT
jgi:hypothetical protein